jgi:hypothetical protein
VIALPGNGKLCEFFSEPWPHWEPHLPRSPRAKTSPPLRAVWD